MTPLIDAAARQLACREFERPIALEAGAGTGKTRTLVARIGTWLLGPGWEEAERDLAAERSARNAPAAIRDEVAARACEGVVAITFTEAAAAEMAQRVDRLLAQAASRRKIVDLDSPPAGLPADELRERGGLLLAASSRLRLSTIHGFCHRLLAELPLEAGLHPSFEVDPENERTAELATEILLARLRAADPSLLELLAAGVEPSAILEALCRLAASGVEPAELQADPFDAATLRPLFEELATAIDQVTALAAPLRALRRAKTVPVALEALDRLREQLDGIEPSAGALTALGDPLAAVERDAAKILERWAKADFLETESAELGAAHERLPDAAGRLARAHASLAPLDPQGWRRAARALAGPLAEVAARRRAAGVLSFDDLLDRATRLLSERPGVRDRVRRGIRQLLVDEFQDTDRRQCDLLRRLILDPSEAPRPGLFLVGDPKQSIYGWRSADLAAYDAFVAELADAGGLEERLVVNFRSAPPVLAEVERALSPSLVAEPGLQASFQPLEASPDHRDATGFVAAGRRPVEYWSSVDRVALGEGRATRAADAAAIEAAAIAGDIRDLVDSHGAGWSDFALLLRTRGDLDTYLDALRRAEVPYLVQSDRSYYRRREVVDTVAALRVLLDPVDLLALVAFLRSPFVGVPDAAWLPLWRAGFPTAMIELNGEQGVDRALAAVRAAAAEPAPAAAAARSKDWVDSLIEAVEAIASLRAELPTRPASDWVERLRARLLLEPIAAARFLGRFGLANLERLLAEIERRLEGEPDPGRALQALRAAIADETPAEEARPPEFDDQAVRVMTVHAAKGLEFRHLYLVQAHKRPQGREGEAAAVVGPAGPRRELVLFGLPTPGWQSVVDRRQRVAGAEAARVLYVAMTRAIDRLVVCGAWGGERRSPAPAGSASPFATLLAHRLSDAPLPTLDEPARLDNHGALWRLAGDGAESIPARAERRSPRPGEPPAPVATPSTRRAAARDRSFRARLLPASGLAVHAELEPLHGDDELEPRAAARRGARGLGVALHHALEHQAEAAAHPAGWRHAAHAALAAEAPDAEGSPAVLDEALDRLLSSALWARLDELAPSVVARELPLLVRSDAGDASQPLAGFTGTLDLLYRDPDSDQLVVADFKSDALDEGGVAAKVEQYRPQLELYGRVVREALGLDAPPRLELWLLSLDRVVEVPPAETGDESE